MGRGNLQAPILFIAEGPGRNEDRDGIPFTGQSGQVFDRLLSGIGLSREDIYITNIIKCHPPGNRDPRPEEQEACMPVPGAWHFMGSVNSCGASLKWWRNNFYPDDLEYEQINKDAASSAPSANRLIYLPYLNGEQSPHFNLNCRGSFVGLAAIHTKADMTRAVMEGATYALRDILTGIRNCGVRPETMRMCGGGSKSPFWRQLMADIYNMPVTLPDMNSENSAALGVAILAAVGTGEYPSVG